jgi:NHS family xanthosine MFS transporter
MSIRLRLIIMNFLEFFVWGSWLISLGGYLIGVLKFSGGQVDRKSTRLNSSHP